MVALDPPFQAGQTLSPDSNVKGSLLGYSKTASTDQTPGTLTIILKSSFSNESTPNDYTSLQPVQNETQCKVNITLTAPLGSMGEKIIERDMEVLQSLIKKDLEVDISGLSVLSYEKKDRMMEASLHGVGDRIVKLADGKNIRLLQRESIIS